MEDSTKKALTAVAVGVGATGAIAATMYFLGGREAPKVPSLGELSAFGKRELLFGAILLRDEDGRNVALFHEYDESKLYADRKQLEGELTSVPYPFEHLGKVYWAVKTESGTLH